MSFPRNADGQLLTILISSIRSKDLGRLSDAGVQERCRGALHIDASNRSSIPLSQIMDAFGLTQRRRGLALAASSGNNVVETAKLLNLSPNTIKTHLRACLRQDGHGRPKQNSPD